MTIPRFILGFDLRVNPDSPDENPLHRDQYLIPDLRNPTSADPNVWPRTEEIENLTAGTIPEFGNPFQLAKSLDGLIAACERHKISIQGLWPACITISLGNLAVLGERFGKEYFSPQLEEDLSGWQFRGFDVIDLDGLVSGLKGCGYTKPLWAQHYKCFGGALNEFGLFPKLDIAAQFAEARGLEIRSHAPFAVTGILTANPISK